MKLRREKLPPTNKMRLFVVAAGVVAAASLLWCRFLWCGVVSFIRPRFSILLPMLCSFAFSILVFVPFFHPSPSNV